MTTVDDNQLLQDYQQTGSERAFEELVRRHVSLVYSAAMRQCGSQPHLVEDIVQKVFIDFAAEARCVTREIKIGGWLHRHTCFVAGTALRTERRRLLREQKALQMNEWDHDSQSIWQRLEPLLDRAINSLADEDRLAIILRFFEKRDLKSVGAALGTNEDAAQKRVARALDKRRKLLSREGVTVPVAVLSTSLFAHSSLAAPAAVTAAVTVSALAGAAAAGAGLGGASTPAAYAMITMGKAKLVYITAALAAGIGTTVFVHQKWIEPLNNENLLLREQLAQRDSQRDAPLAPQEEDSSKLTHEQLRELMRLRSQATQFRQATNQAQKLAEENKRLRAATAAVTPAGDPHKASNGAQYIPIESCQFVGFAQPDAAFQSSIWAMIKGDLDTLSNAWTDDYIQSRMKNWKGQSEEEIKSSLSRDFQKVQGFSVARLEPLSDSEALVEIHLQSDGEPPVHRARMKKIGSDWKFDGFVKN